MKIFAHRGYSGRYPENTMLAFRKAAETGCHGIELDVHKTRDGRLVIIHDELVDRTTDGHGRVCDMSYDELRSLNAAKLFPQLTDFEPIPSLEEYLDWVKGTGLITNIEIKTDNVYYPGIEKDVCDTVRAFGLEDRVIYSSFNHISARRAKELAPSVEVGALVERENFVRVFPGYYCRENGFDCWHPCITMLDDENVRDCRENGIKINVWTVNDIDGLEKARRYKLDSIITNYPMDALLWFRGMESSE